MARIICKCRTILSNQLVPNEVELTVFTHKEWDEILKSEVNESWQIPLPTYEVWRCPVCERVFVFEDGNEEPTHIYKLVE